jgi:hypothetical protein
LSMGIIPVGVNSRPSANMYHIPGHRQIEQYENG